MQKFILLASLGLSVLFMNCAGSGSKESSKEGTIVALTNETFKANVFNYEANSQWQYEGKLPAIVDFYATWCVPCKKLSPILEDLAQKYAGKIVVYRVDVDAEQILAQRMGVTSMPTLLFIPVNGQPQQTVGLLPAETLEKTIHKVLLVK